MSSFNETHSYLSKKVLVVDDNETGQMIATLILQKAGYQVETASDGYQAINLAKTKLYDLILMDLQLPEINGLMATRSIRTLCSPNLDTPVIAFSANITTDILERCHAAGMDSFISKPFDSYQLLETIKKWVNTRSGKRCIV
ncbi:MAG: response regulator [bacterium]|nr:response regulator [Gammaproteobacteria bacterium]HIL96517.1 response regulator [Pseudomonadales bacterium]